MRLLLASIAFLTVCRNVGGCGSGAGTDQFQIIQDPVFNMEMSPPVRWTFFPPAGTGNNILWYFIGQSNDSSTANNAAETDIKAAMIESMSDAQLPTYNVQVTSNYQPQQFENPAGLNNVLTTGVGARYGKVEGGALTQFAQGGSATATFMPFLVQVEVTVRNAQTTLMNWNIVKNNFLQKMSLNYYARFSGDVTITRF